MYIKSNNKIYFIYVLYKFYTSRLFGLRQLLTKISFSTVVTLNRLNRFVPHALLVCYSVSKKILLLSLVSDKEKTASFLVL